MANKYDELWLKETAGHVYHGNTGRVSYFGFLISINIALYVGIYLTGNKNLWTGLDIQLLLLAFLIFINIALSFIYLREHILDKTLYNNLEKYLDSKHSKEIKILRNNISKEDTMKGRVWLMTKIIFSVIISLPLTYLFILLCSPNIYNKIDPRNLFFIICFLILLIIVFNILIAYQKIVLAIEWSMTEEDYAYEQYIEDLISTKLWDETKLKHLFLFICRRRNRGKCFSYNISKT
jgi:hypothetical protein